MYLFNHEAKIYAAVSLLSASSHSLPIAGQKPPAGVDLVTTALLIMIKLEKRNFSWDNAKKMMSKVDAFKEQLEEYRGEDIPEVLRRRNSSERSWF